MAALHLRERGEVGTHTYITAKLISDNHSVTRQLKNSLKNELAKVSFKKDQKGQRNHWPTIVVQKKKKNQKENKHFH